MVASDEPFIALRAWCRLVRAHRAAAMAGRSGEERLLQGRVEQAKARYRALARSATAQQVPDTTVCKAVRVAPLRVVRSAGGFGAHRDSWPLTGYAEVARQDQVARR